MAEVRQLKPTEVTASFAPIPELIEELERLLEQAKSGKLRGAAWAVVFEADAKPDGEATCGFVRGPYTRYAMAFALSELRIKWEAKEHG